MNINLINAANPEKALSSYMTDPQAGDWISYHEGDFSDSIGESNVGRAVRKYSDGGQLMVFQKKVVDEPRRYVYLAYVK